MKYDVMELFPTPLIMTKIEENTDELKLSNKFTRNDNDQKYNYVHYKDGKRILEDYPRIRDLLLEKFVAVADEYLQYKNKEYIITTSWITHSHKGDKSTLHKHLNSFWSGVYYFQDNYPKGTAEISFINPIFIAFSAFIRSPVSNISIACFFATFLDNGTIGVEQKRPIFTPGVAYFDRLLE